MSHLLDDNILSADDVLLVPKLGKLASRSDAKIHPFLYSAPMDTVTGYELTNKLVEAGHQPVVCRNLSDVELEKCLRDFGSNHQVTFAVSTCREWLANFIQLLLKVKLPNNINLAIDVAHGDSVLAHETASWLREQGFVRYLMSGSICTPEGAVRAVEAGCTHLRVGVGPGSVCTTRLQTGCGYPQLTAVYKIHRALEERDHLVDRRSVVVVADGGVRTPGDAAKYLAAGADAIMMGSRFSKAIEAPGWAHVGWKDPELDVDGTVSFPRPDPEPIFGKRYRGHASREFQADHNKMSRCAEGVSTDVMEWDGQDVSTIVNEFEGGVASAVSYVGLLASSEMNPDTVEMIKITHAAVAEGRPHGLV